MLHTLGLKHPRHGAVAGRGDVQRERIWVGGLLNAHISYLRAGDPQGQRVVLVHGTPGKAEGWSDFLLNPPPGIELIALDRPGFAHSGPKQAAPDLEHQAAAVAALLPSDGRQAVLLGHSLGGAVVAQVAVQCPERVVGLVLLAAALDPALERIHPLQPLAARWPLRSLLPKALRHANHELLQFRAELETLATRLHLITTPTHVIHGTQDHLVPYANVAYLQRMLRSVERLQIETLEGGDHFLPWNAQAVVRRALAQWPRVGEAVA
ncbi:alpha/beta hydrolase [Hydrogenophaga sp. PAMC20947]|uniref:alpha/beta fold hydrolase n=1 Tax=Hydrogenophaga sp. PAMC20947 TaxID=2565558 RepID=UPI0014471838|nr:alpha/beta hydrolase [Hydrogenophaga sp. PAMC20947]